MLYDQPEPVALAGHYLAPHPTLAPKAGRTPARLRTVGASEGGMGSVLPAAQVIPPVISLFTRFRPYLAQFLPVFSRFLRVFTASPRRFQRAARSRNRGPRNGGTRPKSSELRPSFDTPDANQRINWEDGGACDLVISNYALSELSVSLQARPSF
eukprot:COSAG04_NODE_1361_length_7086_cov_30.584800_2_plen_155_part_00